MRGAKTDTIAGLPAPVARSLVRLFRGGTLVQDVADRLLIRSGIEDADAAFARMEACGRSELRYIMRTGTLCPLMKAWQGRAIPEGEPHHWSAAAGQGRYMSREHTMGYTHYFPGIRATAGVIADARMIIAASAVTICGPNGQGLPIMTEAEGIRLNGFEAAGEAFETFHLRGSEKPKFAGMAEFCTTGSRPYDEVVTAVLIAAAVRALDSRTGAVKTDGRWGDWAAGLHLFERAVRALTDDEKLALELDVEQMRPELFR